jgi:hypothetical protein
MDFVWTRFGLSVEVVLRDPDDVAVLVDQRMAELPMALQQFTRDAAGEFRRNAAADVAASDITDAIRKTRDALDLLRVFQQSQARTATAAFGLGGDAVAARIQYLPLDDAAGVGWRSDSAHLGFRFTDDLKKAWELSRFAELARMVNEDEPPEGASRAMLAIRLLSLSVLERRPTTRMLYSAIAIEALLCGGGKAYELARRAAFRTCGVVDGDLCGRDRPACEFLRLNPDVQSDRKQLRKLEDAARRATDYRCSEWLDVVDRYADRSAIVHGDPTFHADPKDANGDLFWAVQTATWCPCMANRESVCAPRGP